MDLPFSLDYSHSHLQKCADCGIVKTYTPHPTKEGKTQCVTCWNNSAHLHFTQDFTESELDTFNEFNPLSDYRLRLSHLRSALGRLLRHKYVGNFDERLLIHFGLALDFQTITEKGINYANFVESTSSNNA